MILVLLSLAVLSIPVGVWWWCRPSPKPRPIDERVSVDYSELRAMWPNDIGGIE